MPERVLATIRSTRDMLMPYFGTVEAHTKSGPDGVRSAVTKLDLAVETLLAEELKKIDPGAAFAGEEFGGSREHDRFWLCDPIDGTVQFIRGLPFCSVMLALIEEGVVNFSVIYDFVNDRMYHAERGKGSYMNGERIRVSDRPASDAYISFETRLDNPENIALREKTRKLSQLFASTVSGYEFTLVATGKIEARICRDPWGKDYDFAPGALLVSEAGGIVANIGSSSYDFRNLDLIAANPLVYRALTEGPDAIFPIRS